MMKRTLGRRSPWRSQPKEEHGAVLLLQCGLDVGLDVGHDVGLDVVTYVAWPGLSRGAYITCVLGLSRGAGHL